MDARLPQPYGVVERNAKELIKALSLEWDSCAFTSVRIAFRTDLKAVYLAYSLG
jgi:hypothetical protein